MTTPEGCRECRARHRDTNAKTRTGHDRSKLLQHGISLFLIRVGDVVVEHGLGICCCDGDVINDVAAQSGWARWNRSFELLGKFTFAFFLIVIVVTPVTVGVEEVANGARRTHITLSDTRLNELRGRVYLFDVRFELCFDELGSMQVFSLPQAGRVFGKKGEQLMPACREKTVFLLQASQQLSLIHI